MIQMTESRAIKLEFSFSNSKTRQKVYRIDAIKNVWNGKELEYFFKVFCYKKNFFLTKKTHCVVSFTTMSDFCFVGFGCTRIWTQGFTVLDRTLSVEPQLQPYYLISKFGKHSYVCIVMFYAHVLHFFILFPFWLLSQKLGRRKAKESVSQSYDLNLKECTKWSYRSHFALLRQNTHQK
jgi:hypothetical protein